MEKENTLIEIIMNIKANLKIHFLMDRDIILITNKINKVIGENLKKVLNKASEKLFLKTELYMKENL